jgi:hypothetical protein
MKRLLPHSTRKDFVLPPVVKGRFGSTQDSFHVSQPVNYRRRGVVVKEPKDLKLGVVVCMYNEEALVPFFLQHYWFADKVIVLIGESTDHTNDILNWVTVNAPPKGFFLPKVETSPLNMPHGFDDVTKIEAMNTAARGLAAQGFDWVLLADADELVFPHEDPACKTFKQLLTKVEPHANAVMVRMTNVYRHITDKSLDPELPGPVVMQRRHGLTTPIPGYFKPSLARLNPLPTFGPGHHSVEPNRISRNVRMNGSHWQHADSIFCIRRCVEDRWKRLSKREIAMGYGTGNWNVSKESMEKLLADHLHDPQVI